MWARKKNISIATVYMSQVESKLGDQMVYMLINNLRLIVVISGPYSLFIV